jgi:hypothetical protein
MKSISELQNIRQSKNSELFEKVGLFFAFSNEQFAKNKTPLKEGDKYVSIGAGGYLPKSNIGDFRNGLKEIEKWYRGEIKQNKSEKDEIIYELYNHECFYTGDIATVVELFAGTYTEGQINEIFLKEKLKTKNQEEHAPFL